MAIGNPKTGVTASDLEGIVRAADDEKLSQLYNNPDLISGMHIPQSITLPEMSSRLHYRDASKAAAQPKPPPGPVSDRVAEEFNQQFQGLRSLSEGTPDPMAQQMGQQLGEGLALGGGGPQQLGPPQGMPPQGVPQGMPPQGPPQGPPPGPPQAMASGGLVGFQEGGAAEIMQDLLAPRGGTMNPLARAMAERDMAERIPGYAENVGSLSPTQRERFAYEYSDPYELAPWAEEMQGPSVRDYNPASQPWYLRGGEPGFNLDTMARGATRQGAGLGKGLWSLADTVGSAGLWGLTGQTNWKDVAANPLSSLGWAALSFTPAKWLAMAGKAKGLAGWKKAKDLYGMGLPGATVATAQALGRGVNTGRFGANPLMKYIQGKQLQWAGNKGFTLGANHPLVKSGARKQGTFASNADIASIMGRNAALKVGLPLGGAGLMGLSMFGEDTPEGLNYDQFGFDPFMDSDKYLKQFENQQSAAVQADMAKGTAGHDAMSRLGRIAGYTEWLEKETPEEEALRQFQTKMAGTMSDRAGAMGGRIDKERDRGEGLASLLGASAASVMGGGATPLIQEIDKQRTLGEKHRTRNEAIQDAVYAMEDRGFGFEALPLESARARSRSRNITMPMEEKVMSELQQQVANLDIALIGASSAERTAAIQAESNLQMQKLAIQQSNQFSPNDFESMMAMAARVASYMPDKEQQDQYMQSRAYEFQAMMQRMQRMTLAAQSQFLED